MSNRQRGPWGQGQVVQIGPKSFRLRWSGGNDPFTGKRVRQTLTLHDTTLAAARRELNARLVDRNKHTRLTLGQLVDSTLPQLKVAARTRDNYRLALDKIPDGARAWRVEDVTPTKAANLIDGLAERHGAATVRKAVGAIQSCWKQAWRNGWVPPLEQSPWRNQVLPELTGEGGRVLTDAEISAIRAHALPGMEEAWIELHLGTGARPGEVVSVRRSDVDLEQSTVRLIDRKHGGRPRTVAIDATTASVLADWFELQTDRVGGRLVDDPFVLSMDVEGATPWRADYASSYRWHALARRANLRLRADDPTKSELPLYSLRHTHNSLLAASGVSAAIRGRRIGNTEQTNASTYTHLVSREDREAAAIIERRLGVRSR